jgi:hypothetical protein
LRRIDAPRYGRRPLCNRLANIQSSTLPQEMGLNGPDDYCAKHSDEEVLALLDTTRADPRRCTRRLARLGRNFGLAIGRHLVVLRGEVNQAVLPCLVSQVFSWSDIDRNSKSSIGAQSSMIIVTVTPGEGQFGSVRVSLSSRALVMSSTSSCLHFCDPVSGFLRDRRRRRT